MVSFQNKDILKVLNAKLDRIQVDLVHLMADAKPVLLDQSTQGRLSRMDAIQQQEMNASLISRMHQEERKISAAINRVNDGTYGICCKCGENIDPNRLNSDPAAPFCSECTTS
ncbi:MAG: TraR/DksA C4-type zinc finger protein [Methylotenera sp.]|nr:TraR/DksA C4-type zinc finger protein [Methylotenera sp.]